MVKRDIEEMLTVGKEKTASDARFAERCLAS